MLVKEIEELVYEYGDDLYRYCYHLTSNKELADELYQETFLKAVQLSHRLNRSGNCKSHDGILYEVNGWNVSVDDMKKVIDEME